MTVRRPELREKCYRFIVAYCANHDGGSPTLTEIQEGVGAGSRQGVSNALRALRRDYLIDFQDGRQRTIRPIPRDDAHFRRGFERGVLALVEAETVGFTVRVDATGDYFLFRCENLEKALAGPFSTVEGALGHIQRMAGWGTI